jgi:hypothetical protein
MTASEPADRFVLFATVGDAGTARIYAARLESLDIEVRLRGEALGPYPLTVGQMAATEIWVPASRLAEAGQHMLEIEVDGIVPDEEPGASGPRIGWQVVALGLLTAIVAVILRLL